MAFGRKKRAVPEEDRASTDYYKLHTDAVDDLVHADESNSPEVPESELLKYRSGPRLRLGAGAKAVLVKLWFAGSVCFFIFWGLSAYITARLDLLVVFGAALGVVTDLLTNNVLRNLAVTEHGNDRWMMFPRRSYASFVCNIFYALWLLFCTDMLYSLINLALLSLGAGAALGVEPILFGAVYTGADLLFIALKHLGRQILIDARRSVAQNK